MRSLFVSILWLAVGSVVACGSAQRTGTGSGGTGGTQTGEAGSGGASAGTTGGASAGTGGASAGTTGAGGATGGYDGGNDAPSGGPTIVSTVPGNGVMGVDIKAVITVEFSEPMDKAATTIAVVPAVTLMTSVGWNATATVVTFTPAANLAPNTSYMVTVTGRNGSGQSLTGTTSFTFKTGVPDTTAPTVVSTSPANNATDVAASATLSVTFSEPMNPGTVDLTISPPVTLGDVMVNDAGTIASVTGPLSPATTYTVTITGKDLAGNALGGTTTSFKFTTAQPPDTVRPTVVSTVPAGGSTGVAFQTVIAVTFSEAMNQAMTAAAITISPAVSCLGGSWTWNATGTFASCQPATALPAATAYTVTVGTGARDLAGNTLQAASAFSFTTANAADTTPPTIVSVSPAAGSTGAALTANIVVTFSEPMNLASAQTAFQVTSPTGVTGTFSWSGGGTVLTFDPAASFASGQTVTFSVSMAAQDAAGNAKVANNSYSFRTLRRGSVVLYSVGTNDGFIESTPAVTLTGINLRAGDSANNTYYQTYMSFDLALPGVTTDTEAQTTIVSATLEVTQYFSSITSDPAMVYSMLGPLRFEHVTYGPTLEAADMTTASLRAWSTSVSDMGVKAFTISTAVRDDWTNRVARGRRTQFRMRFTTNTTTNDKAEYISVYSGDYTTMPDDRPHITVQYDYP